ncbi:hypothetical protein MBLNU459_g5863t1 [Dothideomycetes sp. NU459]
MDERTVPATPVGQIIDSDEEEEEVLRQDDLHSESPAAVAITDGTIRGLGDCLPDPVDELTSQLAILKLKRLQLIHIPSRLHGQIAEAVNQDPDQRAKRANDVVVEISQPKGQESSLQHSADDSAALINQSIMHGATEPEAAKTSKLRRISQRSSVYHGIHNQRRLKTTSRSDLFDVDNPPERLVRATNQLRAPSVDLEELKWPAQTTVPVIKKRKVVQQSVPEIPNQQANYGHRSKLAKDGPRMEPESRPNGEMDADEVASSGINGARQDRLSYEKPNSRAKPQKHDALQSTRDNTARDLEVPQVRRKRGRPRKAATAGLHLRAETHDPSSAMQPAHNGNDAEERHTSPAAAAIDPVEVNTDAQRAGESPLVVETSNSSEEPRVGQKPSREEGAKTLENPSVQSHSNGKSEVTDGRTGTVSSGAPRSDGADDDDDNNDHDYDEDHYSESDCEELGQVLLSEESAKLLRGAFKAANAIATMCRENESFPPLRTTDAKELLQSCREMSGFLAIRSTARLVGEAEQIGTQHDGNDTKLTHMIKNICRQSIEMVGSNKDWDNRKTVRDVFAYVLPKLTLLVRSLMKNYASEGSDLTYDQLKAVRRLIKTIVGMGRKVQGGEARKKAFSVAIKRPVRSIVGSLDRAQGDFELRIAKIEENCAAVKRAERAQLAHARQEEDERRKTRQAGERAWLHGWARLHSDRYAAELRGKHALRPEKDRHLRVVPLTRHGPQSPEVDANGQPIERMQMFGRREGQAPPDHDTDNTFQPFELEPLYALRKGLEAYAGPRVYQRIFDEYCRDGQPLQPYNVSEIVEQAVWLRRCLIEDSEAQGVEVEDWVYGIPDPRVAPQ